MHEEIVMLALVLMAALAGGRLAVRLGYPSILGEITAGILLGPPLLGVLASNEAIEILGEFGVLLMMLYIGMHLDLGDLRRASRPGLLAAVGGFIVPTADRKSTRLNSSHVKISYAVFCLKKKNN